MLKKLARVLAIAAALVAVFVVGRCTVRGKPAEKPAAEKAQAPEQKVKMWTCAMHPQIRLSKPGKCPICFMDLVPVQEEEEQAVGLRRFVTTPEAKALMDIQTSPVERRFVTVEIRMVGKITYDESRQRTIAPYVPGRLDRLYVDYTGVLVNKGDHVAEIYSPELVAAQEELLQTMRAVEELKASEFNIVRETTEATLKAAHDKLLLWGLTEDQIREIEKSGKPFIHQTIYTPLTGVVLEKRVNVGMYVDTGTPLYIIADLTEVWAKLDAYEADLEWVRYGQDVAFTTEAFPGQTFLGRIAFIDRTVDPVTRTVKLRVNVHNLDLKLKPDMFVRGIVQAEVAEGGVILAREFEGKWLCPMHPWIAKDSAGHCDICDMPLEKAESFGYIAPVAEEAAKPLVIPVSAALVTGKRAVVYLEVQGAEKPTYEGREIVLGPRAGDYYIVKSGLNEGDIVVTRGNFKIDSAIQIQAKPSMMQPEGGGAAGAHMHGGAAPTPGAAAAPAPEMKVPEAFQHQLHQVEGAYLAVSDAIKAEDLARTTKAFASLGESVKAVDKSVVSGQMLAMWNELAMLMGNDAFEGAEAKGLEEAERVFARSERNIQRMSQYFMLEHEHEAAAEPKRFETPAAFQEQIGKLLNAYLALHESLAADNQEQAARGVKALQDALSVVDMELLKGDAHMGWMEDLSKLEKTLNEMAGAKDSDSLRAGFAVLSEEMEQTIKRYGLSPAAPVYKLHCPMAFEGKGADWLQKDKETRNPYFGSQMPKCGDVVEEIK